jgi:hypothetical protein
MLRKFKVLKWYFRNAIIQNPLSITDITGLEHFAVYIRMYAGRIFVQFDTDVMALEVIKIIHNFLHSVTPT